MNIQDKSSYSKYINSAKWKNKIKQRLIIANHKCEICGAEHIRLECHHRHYDSFMNENVEKDLIMVCVPCHDIFTNEMRQKRYSKNTIKMLIDKLKYKNSTKTEKPSLIKNKIDKIGVMYYNNSLSHKSEGLCG